MTADAITAIPAPAPATPSRGAVSVLSRGDTTFEAFCHTNHASLSNALGWALGSNDLGREAADEAFARAFERWPEVSIMSNPAGWVYRVGLNWGRRRIWRRNRERELLATTDPDVHHDAHVDHDLARALTKLPMTFRSVVVMRHLLGYSERETARALGISPGTAKSRMSRGLERLRRQLEATTNEAAPTATPNRSNRTG